jgi:hypothetical protein
MRKSAPKVIGLAPRAAAGFAVGREIVRMTCLSGTLWVTCNADPRDYVLTAGQQFVPRSGGRLVVQAMAMSPARFCLRGSGAKSNPPAG